MANIKLHIDRNRLFELYTTERNSITKIAEIFKTNPETIRRRLHEFVIPVRGKGEAKRRSDVTKEILEQKYMIERKSLEQIGKDFGVSQTLIHNRLHGYGIAARYKGEAIKGRKFTIDHKIKLSKSKLGKLRGELNNNWRGGIARENLIARNSREYKTFRKAILRFHGEKCNKCGKELLIPCPCCGHIPDRHVHHIKSFATCIEGRFDFNNVIVLCHPCHLSQHTKKELSTNS